MRIDFVPFFHGLTDPLRGVGFVLSRRPLVKLSLIPFLIAVLLYTVGFVVLLSLLDNLLDLFWARPAGGLLLVLYHVALMITAILALGGMLLSFTFVASAVAAPFLGRLARRVREELEGSPPDPASGITADVLYPLWLNLRLLLLSVGLQVGGFAVQVFIPGSTLVVGPAQFLVAAFLVSLTFLDYPLETEKVLPGFRGRVEYGRLHLLRTLGMGTTLLVISMIPLVGYLMLPAGVAGATIFYHEEEEGRRMWR